MMKTRIKKCVVAVLVTAGVCAAYAQSAVRDLANIADAYTDRSREKREQTAAPDHIKAIFALAKTSAEEDFNVNFCGFFTGMSRYDAQDLAAYYKLKDGEYLISAAPGKAVSKLWFSLKGVRRITRGGNTFDELAQAVANRVGDMKRDWKSGMYEHRTIDGVIVKMGREYLSIENVGVASKKPVVTKANAQRDEKDTKSPLGSIPVPVVSIIQNMVTIPGKNYKMCRTEVTQAQWAAVMGNNPSASKNLDNPVENVSWDDCQKFLKKLNAFPAVKELGLVFRLPTKKEWEYACRAGGTGDYCKLADGTEITKSTLGEVAWYGDNSNDTTHPVGQKKPNAFGLYDMHGNVWEWCEDWRERWDGANRVDCGGSWSSASSFCTAGYSDSNRPNYRSEFLGFRLVALTEADRKAEIEATARAAEATARAAEAAARATARAAAEAAQKEKEEKAAAAKERTEIIQGIIANMVSIPGKKYMIGKYEVTQKQWRAFMKTNPSKFKGDDHPVEGVINWFINSEDSGKMFLERLNAISEVKAAGLTFRLPTEDEWIYACRGGKEERSLFGGGIDFCKLADGTKITERTLEKVAWYSKNSGRVTHPVGQKMPNAFGLYDMLGNVSELCVKGNKKIEVGSRDFVERCVEKGGSFEDSAGDCTLVTRTSYRIGFRLAADQR